MALLGLFAFVALVAAQVSSVVFAAHYGAGGEVRPGL